MIVKMDVAAVVKFSAWKRRIGLDAKYVLPNINRAQAAERAEK